MAKRSVKPKNPLKKPKPLFKAEKVKQRNRKNK